jgi:hypothetical protein
MILGCGVGKSSSESADQAPAFPPPANPIFAAGLWGMEIKQHQDVCCHGVDPGAANN